MSKGISNLDVFKGLIALTMFLVQAWIFYKNHFSFESKTSDALVYKYTKENFGTFPSYIESHETISRGNEFSLLIVDMCNNNCLGRIYSPRVCKTILERAQFNRKLYHKNITKCGVKQLKMKMSFCKSYGFFTLLVS